MDLFGVVKTARRITDSVLVGFSGGKDSAVTLDVCFRYFAHVQPYFMYLVPDLEFQERTLRHYEARYHTEILRVPHFMLSDFLRYGSFRMPDMFVPSVKTADLYEHLRNETGIYWIAAGERIADSTVRRAMIKHSGSIDKKRGRIYPLAYWNKAQVLSYLKLRRLPLSLENQALGFSFRGLDGAQMKAIKENFPADFEKIKAAFPLIEASIVHEEYVNGKK